MNPHNSGKNPIYLNKDTIIHYHAWANNRYNYEQNMEKIEFLHEFYQT